MTTSRLIDTALITGWIGAALVTAPLSFGLGLGFALPLILVGVPARALLLVAGRRALR